MNRGVKEKVLFCGWQEAMVTMQEGSTSMARLQHEQVQKGEQESW